MHFADVLVRYPATVELCGGRARFFRVLDHSLRVQLDSPRGPGSGSRRNYTHAQVTRIAIRRLLGNLIGGDVPHSFDHAIDFATWDHEQRTCSLAVPERYGVHAGAVITLCVPDELWSEHAPELVRAATS